MECGDPSPLSDEQNKSHSARNDVNHAPFHPQRFAANWPASSQSGDKSPLSENPWRTTSHAVP